MGIFDNMFGGGSSSKNSEEKAALPWQELKSVDQIDSIVEDSKSKPVAIFKHSTTCGISRMALRQFESQYDIDASQMDLYYLDLKAYRDVSNEVGYRFQVIHQSPQLILVKNGTAVYNESHGSISASALENKL